MGAGGFWKKKLVPSLIKETHVKLRSNSSPEGGPMDATNICRMDPYAPQDLRTFHAMIREEETPRKKHRTLKGTF